MLSHAIFTPGQPGWLDEVDRAIAEDQPDSFKGYTIGDNTHKELSRYPWRLDDEKLLYPFYEKMREGRHQQRLRAQGSVPAVGRAAVSALRDLCDVGDVGKAAKDWPQLNFIIYHSAYRFLGGGRRRRRWRSSSRPVASSGSPTSPRFRRSTASTTSTAISGRSSP